jgi:ABC-type multidrug transport system ATPase subunit
LLEHLAILKGINNKVQRKQQIAALLHQTNLTEHQHKAVHTFSGGMRQRFGIAQALLGDPKIIIVDEPTAGLDPEERNRFNNLLSAIGEQVIVILSTHIVEDVRDLCTRMAIIAKGTLLTEGNPKVFIENLDGQIWSKTISRQDLEQYTSRFKVISSRLQGGKLNIHVYAPERPEEGFHNVYPDLEDVYFRELFA